MTTPSFSNPSFESTILAGANAFPASSRAAARSARTARAAEVPEVSASLWRESMKEATAHGTHQRVARGFLVVLGALGLSSVGYAAWQTCALMSGSTLHDAVSAFVR